MSDWETVDYLAYAAARMPATYQATAAVYREIQTRCPGLSVNSLLDVGAGPATGLWAAWTAFDELRSATLVESDRGMVELGKELTSGAELIRRVATTWHTIDIDRFEPAPSSHDLAVASYVLAELDDERRRKLVDLAWDASRGVVALIEPGSRRGYLHVMEARDRLIELGARIIAPCPHAQPCPLPADDWCHFGVRLNRTAMQRRLKAGALAYEDEKYAFVVATKALGAPAASRVLRRPQIGPGRVTLRLCRIEGLAEEMVPRSRREAYRAARKTRWGDSWS